MKRFTETTKWADKWFRALSRDTKLAFYYIVENCDAAGVWEADTDLADFCIGGEALDWDAVLSDMGERVHVLPDGKWCLTKFIDFQYGQLSEECKPHVAVLKLLKGHGISLEYIKGIHTLPAKGSLTLQDKDKEKDKERVPGGLLLLEQAMPTALDNPEFRAAWMDWLGYRRERHLPKLPPKSIDSQLQRIAGWGCGAAIQAIRASIANNWQGLFEPKGEPSRPSGRRMSFA